MMCCEVPVLGALANEQEEEQLDFPFPLKIEEHLDFPFLCSESAMLNTGSNRLTCRRKVKGQWRRKDRRLMCILNVCGVESSSWNSSSDPGCRDRERQLRGWKIFCALYSRTERATHVSAIHSLSNSRSLLLSKSMSLRRARKFRWSVRAGVNTILSQ